jgi:hypothetical protein
MTAERSMRGSQAIKTKAVNYASSELPVRISMVALPRAGFPDERKGGVSCG